MTSIMSMRESVTVLLATSILLLTIAGQLVRADGNASYVAVAPQVVRANSAYDVSVTVFHSTGNVIVNVSLVDDSNVTVTQNQTTIASGVTTIVTLQVPADLSQQSYTLVVQGFGGLSFLQSRSVDVKAKTLSIFVQTDKAMYKPGQQVLFRAVVVHPDLKPYNGEINVSISDNSGNKIAQWLNQKNSTGVFSNKLQLADQPPLGTWTIGVTAQDNTVTKTFNVAEYVLPLFEVKVDLPSYYLVMVNNRGFQQDLWAKVSAMYTYGQPVKGRASVNISIVQYAYSDEQAAQPYILRDVELVNGSANVRLTISDLLSLTPISWYTLQYNYSYDLWSLLSYRTILVIANVTETATGKVLSGNNTVQCSSQKYVLSFMDITASSFKPGLALFAFMQLKQQDGSPPVAADIESKSVGVTVTCNYGYIYPNYTEPTSTPLNVAIPSSGLMIFSFAVNADCSSINLAAIFNDSSSNASTSAYKYLSKFNSRDGEGIQITLDNSGGQITSGQTASFTLKSTRNITSFAYQLLSKGIIIKSGQWTGPLSAIHHLDMNIDSRLAQLLAPSARLIAWYITELGEIVSDSLDFSVTGAFSNEVSVSFSAGANTVQPADSVSVSVKAYQGSYVGLLAVDQSVLLLQSGNDITQDQVLEDLSNYDSKSDQSIYSPRPLGAPPRGGVLARRRRRSIYCRWCWWPYFSGGTDTSEVFSNAGVIVLTDAYIYQTPYEGYYPPFRFATGLAGPAGPAPGARSDTPESAPQSPSSGTSTPAVRMNFPETWLWTELTAGLDGSATLKATVPDTITSWVLSAFAVSPDVGLGIAPNLAKLTVFKPFFVSVNIPYSIIRGERFVAQVTVFNYLSTTVQAVVTLQESEYFVVRMDNDILPASQTVTATVKVSSNDAASVYFWIIPQTLGQIPIEVKATSGMAADAVEVMLLVEPEGVSQEYSTSVFFSLSAGQTADTTLNVSIPANFVPGSEYFQVTAIGTLLGQSLNGLGNLLQMPYGCGEQNMLTFAPDVYVLKYLQITGQDGGSIAKDAREYIGAGYQRELTFQRLDGSFSAFGNSDPAGSVWLSAFVIKCFHEAKQFVIVDDGKIAVTLNWLANLQAANGSFSEPPNGRVIHTDMQGGSAGGVPLTAYVLISLMENADNSQVTSLNFTTARAKAIRYLESQLSLVTSDPYALSIITYALTLANSSQAETAFGYLNALAVNKDGLKYWHKPSDVPTYTDNRLWHPPYEQARSVDIEMTAYALLTYTVRRDFSGGVAIAKWIVSQRNSLGGFSSTQDTVVALQALSTFATLTSGGSGSGGAQNLLIRLTASSLSYQFSITATNSLVLQSVQIPTNATKVSLHVTGTGVGLVQLNVKYNVRGEDSKKRRKRAAVEAAMTGATSIQLQVNNVQTDDKHIALNVCVRWFGNDSSGMAIIEIGLPTGYTADNVDDLKNQAGGLIRRVDSGTTSLVLYLDEFTTNSTCVNVLLTKVRIVDNIQPAIVTAYLYYDPGQRDTLEYQPTPSNVTYCDQCPQCCGCRLASSKCEILAKSVAAAQQLATLKLSCLATLAVIVLATKLQLSF